MNEKSMTALVSAFSRAYHCQNNSIKIFHDPIAKTLLGKEDYTQIANNMANGIAFFNPNFAGSKTEALRWIVDNHLSPTPLARAAFAEKALQCAIPFGVKQYIILAAGYFASYSYTEMEELLCDCDFLIYEHLTPQEMTHQYFSEYNIYNPNHAMKAADNVNYCLAVKR